MFKGLLMGFLGLVSAPGVAQTTADSTGMVLFNLGRTYYEKGQLDSTLAIWSRIVDRGIGRHYDTYGSALFNIPNLYWQKKEYAKAKEGYRRVLASDLRDNAETGSLMEPHTNYKHQAAVALAGLYQIDNDYAEVVAWLDKAQTLYPYWGFEGSATSISLKEVHLLEWKTDALLKQHKQAEAVREIILDLVYAGYPKEYFQEAIDGLFTLLDKKSFSSDFGKALDKMVVKPAGKGWVASFLFQGILYQIPVSKERPSRAEPHFFRVLFIPKDQKVTSVALKDYILQLGLFKDLK